MIRRSRLLLPLMIVLSLQDCATSLFTGGTAKDNAVQALVTTTRSAVLMMTAAGIAYDAGAFGTPGSPKAEQTWDRIADESKRMNAALTAWSEAIKANKDASAYAALVSQGLAVIGALLPARTHSELIVPPLMDRDVPAAIARLARPEAFRAAISGGV